MKAGLRAFSILEAVLALALFLLLVSGLGAWSSLDLGRLSDRQKLIEAEALVQEARVLVNHIARRDWSLVNVTVNRLAYQNDVWTLLGDGLAEDLGDYQRQIGIAELCRDVDGLVVDCPGQSVDSGAYKLTVSLTWSDSQGPKNLERSFYLTER